MYGYNKKINPREKRLTDWRRVWADARRRRSFARSLTRKDRAGKQRGKDSRTRARERRRRRNQTQTQTRADGRGLFARARTPSSRRRPWRRPSTHHRRRPVSAPPSSSSSSSLIQNSSDSSSSFVHHGPTRATHHHPLSRCRLPERPHQCHPSSRVSPTVHHPRPHTRRTSTSTVLVSIQSSSSSVARRASVVAPQTLTPSTPLVVINQINHLFIFKKPSIQFHA